MTQRYSRGTVSLPKFNREDVFSVMQVQQHVGWGVSNLGVPDLWSKTQGEGIKIAVIDTGVQLDHPDLDENLLAGFNALNRRKEPLDDVGHGTHVTGIMVAENNEIGMVGVCPKSKVIPIKVLDHNGNGVLGNVANGIKFAIKAKADIICMSLGSPNIVPEVHRAIKMASAVGIAVFVAGGNMGKSKKVLYPAAYKESIAIGSVDENFKRSSFSNTGNELDFMAPGGKIFSTVPDSWYSYMSGTSMATPFAAGVYSLLLSHMKYSLNTNVPKTPDEIREVLRKGVRGGAQKFYEGYGVIDPSLLFDSKKRK